MYFFSWFLAPQNPLLTRSASWSSLSRVGRVTDGAASGSASQGWSLRSPRRAVSARAAGDGPTCQILARTIYRDWTEFAVPLDQQVWHEATTRLIKTWQVCEATQPMFRHKLVTHWSLTASLGVFSNNPVWGSGRGLQNCYKRIKEKN